MEGGSLGITASGRALDKPIFLETIIGGGAWISAGAEPHLSEGGENPGRGGWGREGIGEWEHLFRGLRKRRPPARCGAPKGANDCTVAHASSSPGLPGAPHLNRPKQPYAPSEAAAAHCSPSSAKSSMVWLTTSEYHLRWMTRSLRLSAGSTTSPPSL